MKKLLIFILSVVFLISCNGNISPSVRTGASPSIFPDYAGVTIPRNIAPMNFRITGHDSGRSVAVIGNSNESFSVKGPEFRIPEEKWKRILSFGEDISVQVFSRINGTWLEYDPFVMYVSKDTVDSHLAYRLIAPGYETWNEMGIYQRNITNFDERPVITNEKTDKNCMNCHTFCNRDASRMAFHMRAAHGGTYLWNGGKLEKLDTKTDNTISAGVYPYWHPSGRFIAFSVNDIMQAFHSTNRNRIEVYDADSDIVVYDINSNHVFSCPLLMDKSRLESFPSFSPDGRTLYFCSSPRQDVPEGYRNIRYSICAIPFDPETMTFGEAVDTLYNADVSGKSAVLPRVSPDGRFMMYTEHDYGCFAIWHKESDLRLLDMNAGEVINTDILDSSDAESYHSWSSNGRWVVFSSRRMDGLYTRPFIAHIDADGTASKPFVLPQLDTYHYDRSLCSFNIPEFVSSHICLDETEIVDCAFGSSIEVN